MATHSSILAWQTPWTEEPGGQQSTGSSCSSREGSPYSPLCAALAAGTLQVWGGVFWLTQPCPEGWAQLLSWFWPPWQQQPPACCPAEDLKRQDLTPACSQTVKDVFPRPLADQTGNGRKFSVTRNTLFAKFSLQQAKIYNLQGTTLTSIVIT